MNIDQYGNFSLTIDSKKLVRGLRPSKRTPRNEGFLVEASGAVGRDGALQVLDALTRMDTSTITDTFPYPQLFVFTNLIIVCSQKVIYEWVAGALVTKYTAALAGGTWSAVDFYDYVYLSNGDIAVVRDAESKVYALTAALPSATAICNFNGQVLIGAPGLTAGERLMMAAHLSLTVTQLGTMTTT
jgi:hypothetical protein